MGRRTVGGDRHGPAGHNRRTSTTKFRENYYGGESGIGVANLSRTGRQPIMDLTPDGAIFVAVAEGGGTRFWFELIQPLQTMSTRPRGENPFGKSRTMLRRKVVIGSPIKLFALVSPGPLVIVATCSRRS